jgi:prepilin peptidase CpaA
MPALANLPDYSVLQWLIIGVFPAVMIAGAVWDAALMRIPNWQTGALALAFPIAAAGTALSLESFGLHMAVGAGALVVVMTLFAFGWIGGGDAKLFAATALWLGPSDILAYTLITTLLGGGLTLLLLSFRGLPLPSALVGQTWLLRLHDPQEGVPYGLALAAGGLFIFSGSAWLGA